MAVLTVRKLSDEVHRALRLRAASHGRSTEAEVREILAAAVKPVDRVRLGDALASLGRDVGLSDEEVDRLEEAHDKAPAEPAKLA